MAPAPELEGLIWSVRALSQPEAVQRSLFPVFSLPADELALTFEEYFGPAETSHGAGWTPGQQRALRALDTKLEAMSGPGKDELWITPDCLTDFQWSEVRQLAQEVIFAFHWPSGEPPPLGNTIYISKTGGLQPSPGITLPPFRRTRPAC